MLPLLHPGDVALIRGDKLEAMRSGDVVLFQRSGQIVAQRIGETKNSADSTATVAGRNETTTNSAETQEYLGRIVRLKRKNKQIDFAAGDALENAGKKLRPVRSTKKRVSK